MGVIRIGIASLCGAGKYVGDSRNAVRWLWLLSTTEARTDRQSAEPSAPADHASVGIVSTKRRTSCACRAWSELCSADAIA